MNNTKEYKWMIFSQTYFCAAKIILCKLQNEYDYLLGDKTGKSPKGFRLNTRLFQEVNHPLQDSVNLINPAFFLFNHGIELYLKAIIGNSVMGHDNTQLSLKVVGISKKAKEIIKKTSKHVKNFENTKGEVGRYPVSKTKSKTKKGLDISPNPFSYVNKTYIDKKINDIDFLTKEFRDLYFARFSK